MEKSRAIELLEHLAWDRDIDRNPYGDALNIAIDALKAQLSQESATKGATTDTISRQAAIRWVKTECNPYGKPTLDFESSKKVIEHLKQMPPAQPEIADEQAIVHLQASGWLQSHDKQMYEMGLKERLADDSGSYDALLPPAQPEPQEGHWIKHESPDGGEQYECSECGVLWEFNAGTPEDNEAYFCPKCGAKMTNK